MPRKRAEEGPGGAGRGRFNEAGALCPGKGLVAGTDARSDGGASMRPGHCAPEKDGAAPIVGASVARFNEAGALCPGKGAIMKEAVIWHYKLQ